MTKSFSKITFISLFLFAIMPLAIANAQAIDPAPVLKQNAVINWNINEIDLENLSENAILAKIDFAKNKEKIIAAANNGDDYALYFLGLYAANGAAANAEIANDYFKKSQKLGNKFAAYTLGFGIIGNATNLKEANPAIKYYEQAANSGHIGAMIELGRLYNKGTELPIARDIKKSHFYYEKAIAKNSEQAKIDVAYIYLEGQGVKKDLLKAKKLLLDVAKSKTEFGELARNSLLEEFGIDCVNGPNKC